MSTRPRLLLYQVLVAVLLAALVARELWARAEVAELSPEPSPPQPARARLIDVGARLNYFTQGFPNAADLTETYFESAQAQIDLHVMGFGQTCPLHLHARSDEATLLVGGTAEVEHQFGAQGALQRTEGVYGPGTLIYSPARCAHEFRNPSRTGMLGNLVITAPRFEGNLYVRQGDSRIGGGAPAIASIGGELQAWEGTGEASRLKWLPMGEGLGELLVRTEAKVEAQGAPMAVYLVQGQGWVDLPESRMVGPAWLVILPAGSSATFRAKPGHPLAAVVLATSRLAQAAGPGR